MQFVFFLKAFGKNNIPRLTRNKTNRNDIRTEHKLFLALEDKLLLWRYINFRRAFTLERMLLTTISPDTKLSMIRPCYFTDDVDPKT